MLNKSNIVLLLLAISLIFGACTPQIRFATINKQFVNTQRASQKAALKENLVEKKNTTPFEITAYLKNLNIDSKRKEVLVFAESWLGTPYCYGGIDKNCTDCSGFVKQIYDFAGINLPRTAALQYEYGQDIDNNETTPGDLVFFTRNNKIGHVGIYIGNNQFIHASTNKGVVLQNLDDDFYKQTFAGFKKVL